MFHDSGTERIHRSIICTQYRDMSKFFLTPRRYIRTRGNETADAVSILNENEVKNRDQKTWTGGGGCVSTCSVARVYIHLHSKDNPRGPPPLQQAMSVPEVATVRVKRTFLRTRTSQTNERELESIRIPLKSVTFHQTS